jgi:hypothetical protein
MTKTKRQRAKYPALRPELNLKTRYELIDYDYINNLTEEEKKWLNKFTEEYVNASLNTQDLSSNLHNTDELKKDCYRRNNARNRDILTRAKAAGNYISTEELLVNKKVIKILDEKDLFKKISDALCELKESGSGTDDNGDSTDNF